MWDFLKLTMICVGGYNTEYLGVYLVTVYLYYIEYFLLQLPTEPDTVDNDREAFDRDDGFELSQDASYLANSQVRITGYVYVHVECVAYSTFRGSTVGYSYHLETLNNFECNF